MISFTAFEYLFRSGFRILFSGFLLILEMKYMFLELLFPRFMDGLLFLFTGILSFMLILRFGDDLWKLFAEPVRFKFVLNIT